MKVWVARERYWLLLLPVVALVVRLPGALVSPSSGIYNVDELDLLYTVLGLTAGQTPVNLQWPAGTLLFLLLPITAGNYLLELARTINDHRRSQIGIATI